MSIQLILQVIGQCKFCFCLTFVIFKNSAVYIMVQQHNLHEVIFLIFLSLSQPNITFSFVILHQHLMRLNDKDIQSVMGRGSQVPPPHSVANGRTGILEDRKTLSSVMQSLQSYQSCRKQHHTYAQVDDKTTEGESDQNLFTGMKLCLNELIYKREKTVNYPQRSFPLQEYQ